MEVWSQPGRVGIAQLSLLQCFVMKILMEYGPKVTIWPSNFWRNQALIQIRSKLKKLPQQRAAALWRQPITRKSAPSPPALATPRYASRHSPWRARLVERCYHPSSPCPCSMLSGKPSVNDAEREGSVLKNRVPKNQSRSNCWSSSSRWKLPRPQLDPCVTGATRIATVGHVAEEPVCLYRNG